MMIHGQIFRVNMQILLLIMLTGVSSVLGRASLPHSYLKVQTVQNEVSATETEQVKDLILKRHDSLTKSNVEVAEMETQVPGAQISESRFTQTFLQDMRDGTVKMNTREPLAQTLETSDLTKMTTNYLHKIHNYTGEPHRRVPKEQIVKALGSIRLKSDPGSIQILNSIICTHNITKEVPTSQKLETANLIQISNTMKGTQNGNNEAPPTLNKDAMDSIQMKMSVGEANNKSKAEPVAGSSDIGGSIQIITKNANTQNIATEGPAEVKDMTDFIWKSKTLLETQNHIKGEPPIREKEELTQISKEAARLQNVPKGVTPPRIAEPMDSTQVGRKVAAWDSTKELQEVRNVEKTNLSRVKGDYLATKINDKTFSFHPSRRSALTKNATKGILARQVVLKANDSILMNTAFSAGVAEKTAEDLEKSGILVAPQKITEELPAAWKVETADLTLINDNFSSETRNKTTELHTRAPPICGSLFRCISSCLSSMRLRRQESGSGRNRREEPDLETGPLMQATQPQRPLQEPRPPQPQRPLQGTQRPPQVPHPPPMPRQPHPGRPKIVRPSERNLPNPKSKSPNIEVL